MDLKGAFLKTAAVVWMILLFGTWIYVDAGYAGSTLSFSEVPGGSMGAFVGAMIITIAGWRVIGNLQYQHEADQWREVGQQAGLQPTGSGSPPKLTGTVDGRTVTARFEKHQVSGSEEGGGRLVTFTFADAELAGPADEGLVVGTAGERVRAHNGVGTLDFDDLYETASAAGLVAAETEDLVLVGTSSAVVEAVVDGLSGRALHAIRDLQIVSAGDASGMVAEWAEARNDQMEGVGSSLAEHPVDNLVELVPGDAATVTVETKAAIQDGDELRRFAEGTVAIADAFEDASGAESGF
ncbi:hypothetical protein [Natrinema halophilum]|uniref:Uncharacterized protein n=1 Tax=Natrinema halophilum TaxID=1699371 RepID=A0A7D5KJ96_9EURY|nr:hypothetical protein [Natrinema halophilum]QLG49279.1 hypothetical protein HYG82_10615 [Natrinema halophilum]